jgi:hypothetical protein
MGFTTTLLEKYRDDDTLVTKVQYDFYGDVTGTTIVNVRHFRPSGEQHVLDNINDRGLTEESRLIAQKAIDDLLPNINV